MQRFDIALSSASALRIWWSYNNCTRGGLVYAVCLFHDVMRDEVTVVIISAEGAGVLSVSLYEHRCRVHSRSCRTAAH